MWKRKLEQEKLDNVSKKEQWKRWKSGASEKTSYFKQTKTNSSIPYIENNRKI